MAIDVIYRPAEQADIAALLDLHYKAVHSIPREFYSDATKKSWSPVPAQAQTR